MTELNFFNNESLQTIIIIALFAVFIIATAFVLIKIFKNYINKNRYFDNRVFLIKLPKEKPEDNQKEFNSQQLIEEISKGETIFSSIGGLRAQRGLKASLFGRDDHFSFEIVAMANKIAFYVVTPVKDARSIEQQIDANYPEAVI